MTADTEKPSVSKNTSCLVCDASVGVSTRNSCPIFQQHVTTSDKPVYKIIELVLDLEVQENLVHSVVVCKKCYKLLNEVDELQERITEIQLEVKGNYIKTVRKYDGTLPPDEAVNEEKSVIETSRIKQGPGRPRLKKSPEMKPPLAEVCGESSASNDDVTIVFSDNQKENKSGNSIELGQLEGDKETEEGDDDDDDDTGDVGDADDDEDYIPTLAELGSLSRTESGDVQIKVEVMEEDLTDKVLGKKGLLRKKKGSPSKGEMPALIPAMVVSRDAAVYTCLVCSAEEKFIADAKGITHHLKESHNLRLYICDICGQEFFKRNELSAHLDEHTNIEDREYQCEVCHRIFSNLRLFRVHKRLHYPQVKNWTCDQCGKRYLSRNMLEEHMNVHTGNRPYICSQCGKDFASKYTFKAHEKTHLERPRPFVCNKCNKSFLTQANLQQHERTHSPTRNFVCQICGKGFSTSRNLEVHSVIHTGYKSFICRMCGKAFARKAEIRDHERTHTGEKPYQCEFCGATFSQRSNLQSHKRATHYDDKRYKCMECGKGFKRRRLLDYHMKAAHTGERPYKCNVCAATFIYPEHFKKHRRIHTGEKPFLCEVCGKAFNSRDNRNAHRFVHSDKKPYECLVCGMGFMRKPLLYNHMQTQGHLNDTIVVNQPRLTNTEEDNMVLAQNTAEAMEMAFVTDSDGNTKLMPADSVEMDHNNQDTKMYITELKEHVILKERDDGGMVETDEIVEATEYDETVQHLIIDGQVHFANPGGIETLDGEATEIADVTEITTLEDGTRHLVVPSSRHGYTEQTATVQTEGGTVQLVQIRIPTEGEAQAHWINILQSPDQ
ncbi:zinc finger protein 835-like isoform X2 [Macrosteles quadrilineatus]|uniref:zinc finger protein 835-like isoform X2 n=1 Tax=Macrosteles quadrilineatus TaxID=74068 RepID=UPI0023E262C8|nr:zinc finger protein 835-like isoform X2 [Macrosteles quadrilineatus]